MQISDINANPLILGYVLKLGYFIFSVVVTTEILYSVIINLFIHQPMTILQHH